MLLRRRLCSEHLDRDVAVFRSCPIRVAVLVLTAVSAAGARASQEATTPRLVGGDFAACGKRVLAAGAKQRKPIRRLWGKGKGHFRTQGRFSSASVSGTTWLTEDRCEGTRTFVSAGVVSVYDRVKKQTVTVRAGQSYLARPKK